MISGFCTEMIYGFCNNSKLMFNSHMSIGNEKLEWKNAVIGVVILGLVLFYFYSHGYDLLRALSRFK